MGVSHAYRHCACMARSGAAGRHMCELFFVTRERSVNTNRAHVADDPFPVSTVQANTAQMAHPV